MEEIVAGLNGRVAQDVDEIDAGEAGVGEDPLRLQPLEDLGRLSEHPEAPTMVLVTHHPEEIAPFLSHALLLAGGETVVAGPVEEALTSASLSQAFGVPCELVVEPPRLSA